MSQPQDLIRRARARPVNRLPATLLPSHEQTQASRDNAAVENSLLTELNRFVEAIRVELDKSSSLQWTQLRAMIIPRLYDSVFQVIRSHISQSYSIGAGYVADRTGLSNAFFLTHSDIDEIKALADEFTRKFFGRVTLSLDSTLRRVFTKEPADSTLNPNFISTSIAISASSKALAQGTRLKAKSLMMQQQPMQSPILSAAATADKKKKKKKKPAAATTAPIITEEEMIDDLLVGVSGGLAGATALSLASLAGQQLQQQMQLVWITAADDRVCDICEPMEGQVFSMDDVDFIPQPVDDTHNFCRCRLLLM